MPGTMKAEAIQRSGKNVDPAARLPGFGSPWWVMLSQELNRHDSFVFR